MNLTAPQPLLEALMKRGDFINVELSNAFCVCSSCRLNCRHAMRYKLDGGTDRHRKSLLLSRLIYL